MFKYVVLAILAAVAYFVFVSRNAAHQSNDRQSVYRRHIVLFRGVCGFQVRFALQNRIAEPIRDGILLCGFRVQEGANDAFGPGLRRQCARAGRGCPRRQLRSDANGFPVGDSGVTVFGQGLLSRRVARQDQGSGTTQTQITPSRHPGEHSAGENPGRHGG